MTREEHALKALGFLNDDLRNKFVNLSIDLSMKIEALQTEITNLKTPSAS